MSNPLETYVSTFNNDDIADVLEKLETSVIGEDRDLTIVASLVLALCKSDPTITEDEERFRNAIESLSQALCWALMTQDELDPSKIN